MNSIFPYKYQFKGDVKILLWKEGGDYEDRFLLTRDSKLMQGSTIEELRELADRACLSAGVDWSYDYLVDMDEFIVTLLGLIPGEDTPIKTCDLLLNGWNFINDLLITLSMQSTYDAQNNEHINLIYEKIFWGNNLPSLTPPGESWHPVFSKDEILSIQELFVPLLATLEQKKLI